jgi:hypothetical protein
MGILKRNTATAQPAPEFEGQEDQQVAVETTTAQADAAQETQTPAAETAAAPADKKPAETEAKPEVKAAEPKSEAKAEAKPETKADEAAQPQAESSKRSVVAQRPGPLPSLMGGGAAVNVLLPLEGYFEKNDFEVGYGSFPRLRLDTGMLATNEGAEAGEYVEIQIISYNKSYAISIGDDSEKGKEMVRFSKDGKVIDPLMGDADEDEWAGKPCTEYRDHLQNSMGFEKAKINEYTNIYGVALDSQSKDFKHMNEMVHLQIPAASGRDWKQYQLNRALAVRMGKLVETSANPVVRFSVERVKGKERTFYKLAPTHGVTEPIIGEVADTAQ